MESGLDRIKRAFERDETELKISSFPNTICADDGWAIIDAGTRSTSRARKGRQGGRRSSTGGWLCQLGFAKFMTVGSKP
jgi:hypothetical protein